MNTRARTVYDIKIARLEAKNSALKEKITSLKEQNAGLRKDLSSSRMLLLNIPVAAMLVQSGVVVFANKSATTLLDYPETDLVDRNFLDLIHPSNLAHVKAITESLVRGKPVSDYHEAAFATQAGELLEADAWVRKILFGRRSAFLVCFVKRSLRKKEMQAFLQNHKIEASHRIAATLEEQLSEIMRSIGSSSSAVQEHGKPGTDAAASTTAQVGSVREKLLLMRQNIRAIRTGNKGSAEDSQFDLARVIRDAVAAVRTGVIENSEEEGPPPEVKTYFRNHTLVRGRDEQLRGAFTAIIENALEATSPGGEVHVSVEEHSGRARIYVQDTGSGMTSDVQDRMLDPFFTTKGAHREGMGLYTAYLAIREHGGEIEVRSRDGEGTLFAVDLPVAPKERAFQNSEVSKNGIDGSHILFVTDVSLLGDLVSRAIRSKGGGVMQAISMPQALKLVKKTPFDMVLVNFGTRWIDSVRFLPRLKEQAKGLPIGVINVARKNSAPHVLKRLGADFVAFKPVHMDRMISFVSRELLTRRQ